MAEQVMLTSYLISNACRAASPDDATVAGEVRYWRIAEARLAASPLAMTAPA